MIEIDGSYGEGGGSILRQSLALSMYTGEPFTIEGIRANRPQPGMKMQHLKALNAAQRLSNAQVEGNKKGATKVSFKPERLSSQTLKVDIETAGSITLLLQTLMLPCVFSSKRFKLDVQGGTDVKWSQPVDYLYNVLLPQLKKYADIEFELVRRGYYPQGGGRVKMTIKGGGEPDKEINLTERGNLFQIKGVSHASSELQDRRVSERQARNAQVVLGGLDVPVDVRQEYTKTSSTGSGVTMWAVFGREGGIDFDNPVVLGGDCLGEPKKKAQEVGEEAALSLKEEVDSDAVADKYLADQLVPYMAVAGGKVKTSEITQHALSNIYVAQKFLGCEFGVKGNFIEKL